MGKVFDAVTDAITTPINIVGDALDKIPFVGPYIAPLVLTATGNPELAAAYVGERASNATGNPLSGVLAGLGSYAGNALGSELGSNLGNTVGGQAGDLLNETPANALGNTFGGQAVADSGAGFGTFAGNVLGSSTIGSSIGGAAGSNVGSSLGSNLGASLNPSNSQPGAAPTQGGPTPFTPSRQTALGLPQSLSQFSNLSPQQQESNIATQGVYGGGNGPEESKYFLNLVNNQLVDPTGNVSDMSSLSPIEGSYLNQLGLGGYGNSNDLLQGISRYTG